MGAPMVHSSNKEGPRYLSTAVWDDFRPRRWNDVVILEKIHRTVRYTWRRGGKDSSPGKSDYTTVFFTVWPLVSKTFSQGKETVFVRLDGCTTDLKT